jgi:hypothetical protein
MLYRHCEDCEAKPSRTKQSSDKQVWIASPSLRSGSQ